MTSVAPSPSALATAAEEAPPTQSRPSAGGLPPSAATSAFSRSSVVTTSAPSARRRAAASSQPGRGRSSETVRTPRERASWMTACATALLPPFCTTLSPGDRGTKDSRASAVGGLMVSVAAAASGRLRGTACQLAARKSPPERQVPCEGASGTTQSPGDRCATPGPTAATSNTPSWPGTPGGGGASG